MGGFCVKMGFISFWVGCLVFRLSKRTESWVCLVCFGLVLKLFGGFFEVVFRFLDLEGLVTRNLGPKLRVRSATEVG